MFCRYSWYLQGLKCDGKYENVVAFVMFWRYSWYLQRLKHDGNIIISLCLQCSAGIHGTSRASNAMETQ
jgi:hypothetical protein